MTKITNKSPGVRGVNTKNGIVHLAPGQSEDLDLEEGELKSLSEDWFAVGALSKAERTEVKDSLEKKDGVEKTAAVRTEAEKG